MSNSITVSSEGLNGFLGTVSMSGCIEVLPPWCHVFTLEGPVIITIDGPAGTGKSSVASHLARRLGLDFLDTGAMYRAAALISLDESIEPTDVDALLNAVAGADIHFEWPADKNQLPVITSRGVPIAHRIRNPAVDERVKIVAGIRDLREYLVARQREIALSHPRLVSEGRDQGSVVFEDASVKFFLTARADVRAKRRADQFRRDRVEADEEAILKEITARDYSDEHRKDGPLVCPNDAVVIDSSELEFGKVIDTLERIIRERASKTA